MGKHFRAFQSPTPTLMTSDLITDLHYFLPDITVFLLFYFMGILSVCSSMHCMYAVPTEVRRASWLPWNRNYGQLWVMMCVLGTEQGFSTRSPSTPTWWAISPVPAATVFKYTDLVDLRTKAVSTKGSDDNSSLSQGSSPCLTKQQALRCIFRCNKNSLKIGIFVFIVFF